MPQPLHAPTASSASGKSWTVPLSYSVTGPFVLLLLLAVGLTGYLSFHNGRRAVEDVAARLQDEILARIVQEARTFLDVPLLINQANRSAVELGMPGMGGRQCLRELLRLEPRARVLVASGYAGGNLPKEVRRDGAIGFIGKPFQLTELLARVREALDGND